MRQLQKTEKQTRSLETTNRKRMNVVLEGQASDARVISGFAVFHFRVDSGPLGIKLVDGGVITEVMPGSKAEEAKVCVGDCILQCNSRKICNATSCEAIVLAVQALLIELCSLLSFLGDGLYLDFIPLSQTKQRNML